MTFMICLTQEGYKTISDAVVGLSTDPKASAQDLRHAGELQIELVQHHIAVAHNLFENAHEAEMNCEIGKVRRSENPPSREKKETKSFCPNCGFGVEVDEDGCCASCGADSMGDGVDMLFDYADDHRTVTKAINEDIDDNPPSSGEKE